MHGLVCNRRPKKNSGESSVYAEIAENRIERNRCAQCLNGKIIERAFDSNKFAECCCWCKRYGPFACDTRSLILSILDRHDVVKAASYRPIINTPIRIHLALALGAFCTHRISDEGAHKASITMGMPCTEATKNCTASTSRLGIG